MIKVFIAVKEANIEKVKEVLNSDFKVIGAVDNGQKAKSQIEKLGQNDRPDIIIADAVMSHIDAAGLAQIFGDSIPVCAVGGGVNDRFLSTIFKLGVCWYQQFPVEAECFQGNIKRLLTPSDPLKKAAISFHSKSKEVDLPEVISNILQDLGCPAHIKGYPYLRETLIRGVINPMDLDSITKIIYPEVGKKFMTTPSRTERAMRHAIEVMWSRGNREKIEEIFGYTIDANKGKPTNSEFVALISDNIRQKYRGYSFITK